MMSQTSDISIIIFKHDISQIKIQNVDLYIIILYLRVKYIYSMTKICILKYYYIL